MRKRNFIEPEAECWAGAAAPPERAWLAYTQDRPPPLPCALLSSRNRSFGLEPTRSRAVPLQTNLGFLQPLLWSRLGTLTHSEILSRMGQSVWTVPVKVEACKLNGILESALRVADN